MWLITLCTIIALVYGEPEGMFAPSFFNGKVEGGQKGLPFLPGMGEGRNEGPKEINNPEAGPTIPKKHENPFESSATDSVGNALPWLRPESHANQEPFMSIHKGGINGLPDLKPPPTHQTEPHGMPNEMPEPQPDPDTPVSHHIGHLRPEHKPHHEIPVVNLQNNATEPHSGISHLMGHSEPHRGQELGPHHVELSHRPELNMGQHKQQSNPEQRPHHGMLGHGMLGSHPRPDSQYHHNAGPMRPVGMYGNLQSPMVHQQKPENILHMPMNMNGPRNYPHFSYPHQVDPNTKQNPRPYHHMQSLNMHGYGSVKDTFPFAKEYAFFQPGLEMGENHMPGPMYPMTDPYKPMLLWGKPFMKGDMKPMGKPPMLMQNMLKKVLNGKFKIVANMMRIEAYPIPEGNAYQNFITGIPEPREDIKYLPQILPALPGNGMVQPMIKPMVPMMPRPSEQMVSVPDSKLTLESLLKDYQAMMESTHHKPEPLFETLMKEYQSKLESFNSATTLPATVPTVPTTTELASTAHSSTNSTTPAPLQTTTKSDE